MAKKTKLASPFQPGALKTLALRLKRERKSQGLSQSQVAELAGVHLNFLSQLENGKATARLDKILAVMTTLGLEFKLGYGKRGISE